MEANLVSTTPWILGFEFNIYIFCGYEQVEVAEGGHFPSTALLVVCNGTGLDLATA